MQRQVVALYCRLSPRPDGSYEGVSTQEKWGREYAARQWPTLPVEVFADEGRSAFHDDDRPGYDRLREWLAAGRVAQVWTVEQSRLERREVPWFQLVALFDSARITELHTNRDGVVRLLDEVAGIKAVLNAGEVRKLQKRVNDVLDERAAQGRPSGAVVFGYRHGRDGAGRKALHVHPAEAEAIREAAERVLTGWSLANIARDLHARSFTGVQGGRLTPSGVRKIVTNPTIAGRRIHRGRDVGKGNWEPILDEITWRAVRRKLDSPRTVARADGGTHMVGPAALNSRSGRKYLLTGGLAICGECGHALTGARKQYRSGSRTVANPYLTCTKTRGGCGRIGIRLDPTEGYVVDTLLDALDTPAFRAALAADEHAQRRESATRALNVIQAQRDDLAQMWGAGSLSASEWQAARQGLQAREQEALAELADVPPPPVADLDGVRTAWPAMTLDEQRQFVRIFIERVTICRAKPGTKTFDAERIAITWQ